MLFMLLLLFADDDDDNHLPACPRCTMWSSMGRVMSAESVTIPLVNEL